MTPNIAPLRNVSAFIGLVDLVQNRSANLPGMATFYGPSGWGKTTAVTVAANEFQAHCVQVKQSWTATYLAQSIMKEIGLLPIRGLPAMVDAIGAHLARSDRPLIIDDAQYLVNETRKIGLTRDIYESSQSAVILVGEEKLPQDLTKWENIHNRMLAWEPAEPCNFEDAEHLTKIYCDGVSISDDLLTAIVDASGGSIRRVAINLASAQELARSRGTSEASLSLWGENDFFTGQPPDVRSPEALSPRGAVTPMPLARKARRA